MGTERIVRARFSLTRGRQFDRQSRTRVQSVASLLYRSSFFEPLALPTMRMGKDIGELIAQVLFPLMGKPSRHKVVYGTIQSS